MPQTFRRVKGLSGSECTVHLEDALGHLHLLLLCRDSILAAPLALDLVVLLDLAQRAGMGGIQEWLSSYFKSPRTAPDLYPEHDLFIQHTKLKNTSRWMAGEDQITHLGVEYYTDDYLPEA